MSLDRPRTPTAASRVCYQLAFCDATDPLSFDIQVGYVTHAGSTMKQHHQRYLPLEATHINYISHTVLASAVDFLPIA